MKFIISKTIDAVRALYGANISPTDVVLQETRKEFEGDVTIVVFGLTRFSKKSPEITAQEIGTFLQEKDENVLSYNVVKGFLNIAIKDSYWINCFKAALNDNSFGVGAAKNERVMVEYSSPNTNKPLHLGHVRNNLLGYAVAQIFKAAGYDVIKANLVNDRGIHICKSMLAWQRFGNGETPENTGIKGDHLVGKYYVLFDKEYRAEIKALEEKGLSEEEAKKQAPLMLAAQQMLKDWEDGKQEVVSLWKMMNEWVYAGFDITYKKMGVDFDKYYYESNTYLLGKDLIEEGLKKGVFFRKADNSVWIDLTAEGLDQKLVLRSDGTSVYITQDLGTAELKYKDFGADKSIYVVGNEQDYHFKVLFLILEKLGMSWAKGLFHLSYGMVDLPSGKMKSREGTVVDADDLIEEMVKVAQKHTEALGKVDSFTEEEKAALYKQVGLGALKYHLLKIDPKKRILFDPNESIDFQGHTGPFIQYSYARIQSVLHKAAELNINFSDASIAALNAEEKALVKHIEHYPSAVQEAANAYSPAIIANYTYDLARLFNKFYYENQILKAENTDEVKLRLGLSKLTGNVIKHSMALLGIEVPNKM